jgi:hypothetical protein
MKYIVNNLSEYFQYQEQAIKEIEKLKKKYKNFEFIKLDLSQHQAAINCRGKGVSESLLLSEAVDHLSIPDDMPVLKITARYKVYNIREILKVRDNIGTYQLVLPYSRLMKRSYTVCFLVQALTLKVIASQALKKCDDSNGYYIEHFLYDFAKKRYLPRSRWFPRMDVEQVSGSTGLKSNVFKCYMRKILYCYF